MKVPYPQWTAEFDQLLSGYRTVTVLSHIHPDPDAIGTALGIYHWLKTKGKRVEIANATVELPHHLDFLPGFSKIKTKIDFEDSLIIACDCGSIDRLGFDLSGRVIVNLDHHPTNTQYGTLNLVDPEAVASSEVAWYLLSPLHDFSQEGATALYAALTSDSRNFTTSNVTADVFALAETLIRHGVSVAHVTQQMIHRRSLASLRILGVAIDSLALLHDARIAIMTVTQADLKRTGAQSSDLDGIVDYGRSLVTAQVAMMLVEREQDIKVSLRSKGVNVAHIAKHFGGGGHHMAAGFEAHGVELEVLKRAILDVIKEEDVLS